MRRCGTKVREIFCSIIKAGKCSSDTAEIYVGFLRQMVKSQVHCIAI